MARSKPHHAIPGRVIGYVGYKQIDGETLEIKKLAVSKDSRYYARMRGILEKAKILCSYALNTDAKSFGLCYAFLCLLSQIFASARVLIKAGM